MRSKRNYYDDDVVVATEKAEELKERISPRLLSARSFRAAIVRGFGGEYNGNARRLHPFKHIDGHTSRNG